MMDGEGTALRYTRQGILDRLNGTLGEQSESAARAGGLPAAVLIGLVNRIEGPTVLLTKRTDHLRDHAGQICFPGGRIEPEDESVEAAALREAEEEIGLSPQKVEIIARLSAYDTSTGFRIHPVVGWIEPPFAVRPDEFEVAEVFELPLAFILDPANHQRQSYDRGGVRRKYYVLPYEGRFIWGATAGMLVNFSRLLAAERAVADP
jgi:8-oxo-dGTP pyrophosphatase MutT (NUDIX family)